MKNKSRMHIDVKITKPKTASRFLSLYELLHHEETERESKRVKTNLDGIQKRHEYKRSSDSESKSLPPIRTTNGLIFWAYTVHTAHTYTIGLVYKSFTFIFAFMLDTRNVVFHAFCLGVLKKHLLVY